MQGVLHTAVDDGKELHFCAALLDEYDRYLVLLTGWPETDWQQEPMNQSHLLQARNPPAEQTGKHESR